MITYESGDYAAAEQMYNEWYGSTTKVPFHERYEQFKKGGNESNKFLIFGWILVIAVIAATVWII